MLVWFATIAVLGIRGITMHPEVLEALSPTLRHRLPLRQRVDRASSRSPPWSWRSPGAEALYADMGHFGRPAIARAWLLLVFPACILSYLGQGALILDDPERDQRALLSAHAARRASSRWCSWRRRRR